ncbi:division/cell wall cluster transcriptional repressor MraZ [Accumulibacter sp.]|uniref:division/cell wall cluster transcriptional repressor MraZ n=1 Tax=Accumulibacter sp. TaxID=2053492 RepID=UPI0025FCC6EA|nr:division/cell wall cluster transcriptional repressor MraZ [Accumulibacter sp.]MCM8596561.1 division/cell wall cluster transcriptional repressor MraZ [Accumulibacter sp.]MCM8626906.1 division/cell wall cluster transcriptional repressor MraZ [Accumulibacter sp.]MDS4050709.1 division/cell wall cluster transcriptional repressor MraZ [Accumulibacter sp.]
MFQGAAALSLDAKGRLAIPARHREALVSAADGRLVLTAHPHRCLLLYPEPAWAPIRDRVLAASSLNLQSAAIKRLLVGNAREEAMDTAGRVLIAAELRQFAQLDKQVWLVGQGSHFEIWSDAGWQKQQEAVFALGDQFLPPDLEDLAL